jgi:hypothetical protein
MAEIDRFFKKIEKDKLKEGQLDRIEKKVNTTLTIVGWIGIYSLLVACALLYYIFNH